MIGSRLAFLIVGVAVLSSVRADEWRNCGPGGGGWVQSVLSSRYVQDRLFIGCDVGGFFRSDDGGCHYHTFNSGLQHLWVGTIAEHPHNPEILFVGSQGGIYKSEDGGHTWNEKRTGLPPVQEYSHSLQICKFAFDPTDDRVVYAAEGNPRFLQGGSGVVWKSEDGGETWMVPMKPGSFPAETFCWDISVSPLRREELVISTSRGLFITEDGGVTWKSSNKGLPAHLRTRMLARGASEPNVLYVTLKAEGGENPWSAGVFRSEDGGRTWQERTGGLEKKTGNQGDGAELASWYDCIAVDPRNSDVVYAAGASWVCDKVWKTTDGGKNWHPIFKAPPHQGWIDFWGPWVTTLSMSIGFPEVLTFGTAGTVYRSTDGGCTWKQRYTEERSDARIASTGLELTCLTEIVPDRIQRNKLFFGYLDIGLFLTEDAGRTFSRIMTGVSGDCFSVRPSPDDPLRVWGAFGGKGAKPWHKICESQDGGRSWTPLTEAKDAWSQCWPSSLQCMNRSEPYRLAYLASGYGVGISEDSGRNWRLVSTNEFPLANRISCLVASGRTLIVGLDATDDDDGAIWCSTDLGATWRRLTDENLVMGSVKSIAIRKGVLVAGAREQWSGKRQVMRKGGAWVSLDAGEFWTLAFPNKFCHAVCFAGQRIVIGLDDHAFHDHYVADGVFMSEDLGKTWVSINASGLHNRNISCLAEDPFDEDVIWAGTGGNSAFVRRLPLLEDKKKGKTK